EAEEPLEAPPVGRILGHHERQIAEHLAALGVHSGAPGPPLRVRDPLDVAELVDLLAEARPLLVQRRGIAVAQSRLPVAPAPLPLFVQRAIEGPILDPRRMLPAEFVKSALAVGAAL